MLLAEIKIDLQSKLTTTFKIKKTTWSLKNDSFLKRSLPPFVKLRTKQRLSTLVNQKKLIIINPAKLKLVSINIFLNCKNYSKNIYTFMWKNSSCQKNLETRDIFQNRWFWRFKFSIASIVKICLCLRTTFSIQCSRYFLPISTKTLRIHLFLIAFI